jgi:hypothetical protein
MALARSRTRLFTVCVASPKNLTSQITRLRERKGGFLRSIRGGRTGTPVPLPCPLLQRSKVARMANDSFMLFSYALFAAAMLTQLV